jgi:hypothetical protein
MTGKKVKPEAELPEIELVKDAWPHFDRFIKVMAKAGRQHRVPSEPKAHSESKRRALKGMSVG